MTEAEKLEGHQWCDFFEETVRKESERAMAILAVSVLDEALTAMLKAGLLPCATSDDPLFDGPYAPLGSFSAKIDFSRRMGLLSDGVAQSFHLIRKIRNDFAHNISGCTFEDAKVRGRVRELKKLNDVAQPSRRLHFPPGTVGDFQTAASWLIFWTWTVIETMPSRCPQCGQLHAKHSDPESTDPK